ncbi:MAG TPA: family 78 glycoside hydrolase catalytic domain [Paludibaculum sp.]|jgi:alpha-L-rhamnosidase
MRSSILALACLALPVFAQNPEMKWGDSSRLGRPFAKDPSVIRFDGRYLMYFSLPGEPDSMAGWSVGIAESKDLKNWTRSGEVAPAAEYERKGLAAPQALVVEGKVHLFYQTYGNGPKDAICHAVSTDGLHFTRDATNPIWHPTGAWTAGRAIDAEVVEFQDKWFLYAATRDPGMKIQMLTGAWAPKAKGFSRDAWTQIGDGPLLKPELPWEQDCIEAPSVVRRGDELVMFYAGAYNNAPQQIGVATSRDGMHWARASQAPFLPNGVPGSWNESESGHPGIFTDTDGQSYLFFQGNNDKGKTWYLSYVRIGWKGNRPLIRPRILGVAHIAIFSHDVEASRRFYRGLLGYQEAFDLKNPDGSLSLTFFKINERQYIELFPEKEANSDRLNHIALEVDNAEAMRALLGAYGIKVPASVPKGRTRNSNFTVKDPDGHGVEIVQYEPDSASSQARGKFLPAERISNRLAHVGVISLGLDKSLEFYRDMLGFQETWRGSRDGQVLSWVNLKVPDGDDYIELMLEKEMPAAHKRGTAHHLCLFVDDIAKSKAELESRPAMKQYTQLREIRTGINRKRQLNLFDPDGTRSELMEPNTVDGKPVPSSPAAPPNRAAGAASLRPVELRCEYRANPLGIDETQPRLSWILNATDQQARGLKQTAYRIVASSTPEGAGDVWDSGRQVSAQSTLVPYAGKRLASGQPVYWRVQVWDQAGAASAWSETAHWSMGLLKTEDWKGKWIGLEQTGIWRNPRSPFHQITGARWIWFDEGDPAKQAPAAVRWFRTKINVPANRTLQHAQFVLGADNEFSLQVNGAAAGRGNAPVLPEVIDVTAALKPGENTLLVRARNAKADSAGVIGGLRLDFTEGESIQLITGPAWESAQNESGPWSAAKDLGAYGMEPWGDVGFKEEHALPARMLRKEFTADAGLIRATAYVSGLGLYEMELNGAKVGDHVLSPGLTDYDKRALYVTYDVSKQISAGRNAVGVWLGNGRFWSPRNAVVPTRTLSYGAPRLRLQIELEYAGGRRDTISTDETWKLTAAGPLSANNEYDGEEYDARLEPAGWSRAGFNDSAWQSAAILDAPKAALTAQMAEPLRVTETLQPYTITALRPGVTIVDMGQNMVGWVRLKFNGPRGTRVMIRHAETVKPDGSLYLDNLRSARATNFYTLKGGGTETWEPRFTYHGFRYVEVTNYPGTLTAGGIEGRVVHDDMTRAGEFESSDTLLNKIHRNIFWGIRGNYRSIPTDCPQRDERQGWLGDRSVVSRSESYLYNVAAFYTKFVTDIADAQRPTGSIPDVVPNYWPMYNDGIVWPSTFILGPATIYEQYGDARVIQRNYPAMKKWIEYMRTFLKDGIMPKNTYGDWCVPPEKPELIHSQDPARQTQGALLSTAYYHHMLKLMSRYAAIAGQPDDARDYEALAAQTKAAFLAKYFNEGAAKFDNGTQTSAILPLAFDMAPVASRGAVFDGLVRKIEQESGNHVGVGLVGAQWLMRTLSANGRADLAFTIATQKTYPGWGYMVGKGATTVWELWNGDTADPAMNSGNHVMQVGDLGVWMYEYLAGIRPDPEQPGFRHFRIRPEPVKGLSFVRATHRSPYGEIRSEWRRGANGFTLEVTVPPNTTATIEVPGGGAAETGGLAAVTSDGRITRFEAGSGSYVFNAK